MASSNCSKNNVPPTRINSSLVHWWEQRMFKNKTLVALQAKMTYVNETLQAERGKTDEVRRQEESHLSKRRACRYLTFSVSTIHQHELSGAPALPVELTCSPVSPTRGPCEPHL